MSTDSLSLHRTQVLQQAVKDVRPNVLCNKNNTLMLESLYFSRPPGQSLAVYAHPVAYQYINNQI